MYFMFEPRTPPLGHFGPQGHHLNKLYKGTQDIASNRISKSSASWFQERCNLKQIIDDGPRTANDARWLMAIAHRQPMAQTSLKSWKPDTTFFQI